MHLSMCENIWDTDRNGLQICLFSKKLAFSVVKDCIKTNLGSILLQHYMSYHKFFWLSTMYGFRGDASQWNPSLPSVVLIFMCQILLLSKSPKYSCIRAYFQMLVDKTN